MPTRASTPTTRTRASTSTASIWGGVSPVDQNPALATSPASTDPATSYASTQSGSRAVLHGYAAINQQQPIGWRTYHSIQISLNRRFRDGLLFGFNDTISLSDKQNAALRLQHNADGTITTRADQDQADELLGDNHPQLHLMRAQFVWDLPRYESSSGRPQRSATS